MKVPTSEADRRAKFLDAACSQLGYCVPPDTRSRLIERSGLSAEAMIREIYLSEGIEPIHLESHPHFEQLLALYRKFMAA